MSGHDDNSSMGSVVPGAVFQVFSQSLTRLTRTLCNFWISWFDMILNTLRGVIKGQKEDCQQHRKHWNTGIRHSSGVENYCRHWPNDHINCNFILCMHDFHTHLSYPKLQMQNTTASLLQKNLQMKLINNFGDIAYIPIANMIIGATLVMT